MTRIVRPRQEKRIGNPGSPAAMRVVSQVVVSGTIGSLINRLLIPTIRRANIYLTVFKMASAILKYLCKSWLTLAYQRFSANPMALATLLILSPERVAMRDPILPLATVWM